MIRRGAPAGKNVFAIREIMFEWAGNGILLPSATAAASLVDTYEVMIEFDDRLLTCVSTDLWSFDPNRVGAFTHLSYRFHS